MKLFRPKLLVPLIGTGLFVVGTLLPNAAPAQAATGINPQINFQGRLLLPSGAVVADGNYNMEFQIWQDGNGCVTGCTSANAAANNGGTLKWTEDWIYGTGSPDNRVAVKNGYFSMSLGSLTAFGSSVNWNSDTLWLSMNVGDTSNQSSFASSGGYLIPFRRMTSAVYALQAQSCTTCILQAPTSTAQNTIQPATTGVVGLTVNATNTGTAAQSLVVNQATAADGEDINVSNNSGTAAAGLAVTKTGASGTLTAGLSVTQTSGTLTYGLTFGGTIGTDIKLQNAETIDNANNGIVNISTDSPGSNPITLKLTGTAATIQNSAGNLTIDSASNTLAIAASDTTLQRTASGNYTVDLSDSGTTKLLVTNSGAGAGFVSAKTGYQINGAVPSSGHYLRGDGSTGYVDSTIQGADIPACTSGCNYISNGTAQQTANYNIIASAAGNIGAKIQSASSGTAAVLVAGANTSSTGDLLQLQDVNGANLDRVDVGGNETSMGYYVNPMGGIGSYGNLLLDSEQFDQTGVWAKSASINAITADTQVAPDGNTTAEALTTSAINQTDIQTCATNCTTNGTYTFSVWLRASAGTPATNLRIDTTGGTFSPTTGTAANYTLSTTWQRYSVTQVITGSGTNIKPSILIPASGVTVYAWGGQMVVGSTPGVYVRSTAAQVTATTGAVSNGNLTAVGVNSTSGLLQGTGGITDTGTIQLNVTTAGATTIGSSSAGAVSIQGGAAGTTVNTTGGGLTLSTATSGTLAVTSAGQLNLTGGAASTWSTGTFALTVISSNFNVSNVGVVTLAGNQTKDITTAAAASTNPIKLITGDSSAGASGAVTLQSGNATGGTAGTVSVDTGTGGTGTVALGNTNAGTISIGGNNATHTIGIGNGATGVNATTLGATNSTSTTTIQGGTGSIALLTGANGSGTAGSITLTTGSSSSGNASVTVASSGTSDSTVALKVVNHSGNQVLTVDTNGSQTILGKPGAGGIGGKLVFDDSGDANTFILQTAATSGSTQTWTLPNAAPSAGAQCLQTTSASSNVTLAWNSCGGTVSLQNAYAGSGIGTAAIALTNNASNGISITNVSGNSSSTGAVLSLQNSYTGAMDGLDISSAGTGALLKVTDATTPTDVFTIADGGNATFKSQTNSSTGFQVQNTDGESVFQTGTSQVINNVTNFIADSEFALGSGSCPLTDWSVAGSPTTCQQNTTATNSYEADTSLKLVATTTAGQGITTSTFTSAPSTAAAPAAGGYYTVSFYAMQTSGAPLTGLNLTAAATTPAGAGGTPSSTCTIAGTANNMLTTTGFEQVVCTLTFTGSSTIASLTLKTSGTILSAPTIYISNVQLQQAGSAAGTVSASQIGLLNLRGIITSPVAMQNTANSSMAMQVQNAAGNSLFNINSNNTNIDTTVIGETNITSTSPGQTQSVLQSTYQGTPGATTTQTLGVAPHALGNLMILTIAVASNSINVNSVSGGGVTNWVPVTSKLNSTQPSNVYMYEGTATATGAQTITVTFSANATVATEIINQEFTAGLGANTTWAVQASGNASTTTGTSVSFPSLTSGATNGEVYYGYSSLGSASTGRVNPGTPNMRWYVTSSPNDAEIGYNPDLAPNTTYAPSNLYNTSGFSNTVGAIIAPTADNTVGINGATVVGGNNSAAAFQVQNGAGADMLNVDTSTSTLTVNGGYGGDLAPWSTSTQGIPGAMGQGASAQGNGYMYLMAGNDLGSIDGKVYYGKPNSDGPITFWATTATADIPVIYQMALSTNGYVYQLGGCTTTACTGAYQSAVQFAQINHDGTLGTWEETTPLPQTVVNGSAVAANGYIYVIGGEQGGATVGTNAYYAKVNADGTVGSWTTVAAALPTATQDLGCAYTDNTIMCFGGDNFGSPFTSVQTAQVNASTGAFSNTFCTTSCTQAGGIPSTSNTQLATGLNYLKPVIANGYVYLVGGNLIAPGGSWSPIATTQYAQIDKKGYLTTPWTTSSNGGLPVAVTDGYTTTMNGYIYEFGGVNGSGTLVSPEYYASTSRLQLTGSLDLLGGVQSFMGAGGDASTGSQGGTLTAGNTNIVGSLNVTDQANFGSGLAVAGNLNASGQAAFRGSTNSVNAFQIQNSTGTSVLGVDTTNSNLVINGSFDGGGSTPNGWINNPTANNGTITQDTTPADSNDGRNSASIATGVAANKGPELLAGGISTVPTGAGTWTLSFYAKTTSVANAFSDLSITVNGMTLTTTCNSTLSSTTVNFAGYQRYTCSFTSSSGTLTNIMFGSSTTNSRAFQLDDVQLENAGAASAFDAGGILFGGQVNSSLTIAPASKTISALSVLSPNGASVFDVDTTDTNLISNPGFENGTTGWSAVQTAGTVTIARDTSQSYLGSAALKITTTAGTGGTQFSLNPVVTLLNTQYTVSFYIKLVSGTPTALTVTYSPEGTTTTDTCSATGTAVTTGWQRFSCTIAADNTHTPTIGGYLRIAQLSGTSTWDIDSVQMEAAATASAYSAGNISLNALITSPVTIKNASNSTTAFGVQNAAGNNILGVDTLNNQVLFGQSGVAGKLVVYGSSSGSVTIAAAATISSPYTLTLPSSAGSANQCLANNGSGNGTLTWINCAPTKTITMVPEWPGAVFSVQSGSGNNTGYMQSDYDDTNRHNFYEWNTDQTTAQDYDIITRYQLPSDFSSFVASSWKLYTAADQLDTGTHANTSVQYRVKDSSGTWCYASMQTALDGGGSTSWTQQSLTDPGNGCSFAANSTIMIDIRITNKYFGSSTTWLKVGELSFQYQ